MFQRTSAYVRSSDYDMKRWVKIAVWAPVIAVGLFAFNLFFVSGGVYLFDCRATTAATYDGCSLTPDGSSGPFVCLPVYPPNTLCPVDIPRTVVECVDMYKVYVSFVDDPISYSAYAVQRCQIEAWS